MKENTLSSISPSTSLKEVPAPVDLSLFPPKAVETLAITTLQHQQRELLARLKISLQRLEIFEKQNKDLLHQKYRLEKTLYALRDQIYIYQEKDEFYQKEQKKYQQKLQESQQNLLFAEKEYLDLHEQNQEMTQRCQNYEKKLINYRRYRHRIEIRVRPLIDRLKNLAR